MGTIRDTTALLPDGTEFEFWERENHDSKILYVQAAGRGSGSEGRELGKGGFGKGNSESVNLEDGSAEHPFHSISQAAEVAEPGTRVLIHAGVYRECVSPRKGGTDAEHMICYEAFGDGEVIVKASEVAVGFRKSVGWRTAAMPGQKIDERVRIWEHRLDSDLFRGYNPFCAVNILHDRLFIEYDKTDMTTYLNRRGMVFCDGKPLRQVALYNEMSREEGTYWVEANGQTVHFRLPGDDAPENHLIEVTCREQCFAPAEPFLSYIKVKGITFAHAATGAPVPQRGAVSAYRGHHWVIEDCVIDWSNAVGIDVGNECWHHEFEPGQIVGHSVIRGCTIKDAGVCGIAGLFATHMLVEDNLIQGTGWQKMELSWEAGGMKLHNSVNGLFRRNIFRDTLRADHIWLDCGNENNRITRNLFLNGIQQREAIFVECTRDGVNLIDHNIFWNVEGRFDPAKVPVEPGSSGWYKLEEPDVVNGYAIYGEGTDHLRIVSNLIGKCRSAGYFAKPVPFRAFGLERGGTSRDASFVSNLFYDCGEAAIKMPTKDNRSEGNAYVKMLGGYLRILYPTPEELLHLPAWQEFEGFDLEGQEGWFDIEVDTEQYTLQFSKSASAVPGFPGEAERRGFVYSAEDLKAVPREKLEGQAKVAADVLWSEDFFGGAAEGGAVNVGATDGGAAEGGQTAGPIKTPKEGVVYQIDPRKNRD